MGRVIKDGKTTYLNERMRLALNFTPKMEVG